MSEGRLVAGAGCGYDLQTMKKYLTILAFVAAMPCCKGELEGGYEDSSVMDGGIKDTGGKDKAPPKDTKPGEDKPKGAGPKDTKPNPDKVKPPDKYVPPDSIKIPTTLKRTFKLKLPLFKSNSAWNQKATSASALSSSWDQIEHAYEKMRTASSWYGMDINYDKYSVPIFMAAKTKSNVYLCDYEGNTQHTSAKFPAGAKGGGPLSMPNPAGPIRPAGPTNTDADGHMVLYDPYTHTEHDMWQATTKRSGQCGSHGGGIQGTKVLEAGGYDFFDVYGAGSNYPNKWFSARAMGTPLLAGLILPEDVAVGEIKHALSFATHYPRNMNSSTPWQPYTSDWFYPASYTETGFCEDDSDALAGGQRLRLRNKIVGTSGSTINENNLAPITKMFIKALRTYGAYLVDNAQGFSFYAEDIHTGVLDLPLSKVNQLIGKASGTPLPAGKTKWQVVMEKLNTQVGQFSFGYGSSSSSMDTANFDVVTPAKKP